MLIHGTSYAQLSGSYTINPTQSASNTNYTNWASAVSDLVSGSRTDGGNAQGPGVNAAVTITVFDTVYTTQVTLGAITGTSSSNTVTFKSSGGDSTLCVLKHASSTAAGSDFVVNFNGCSFVTLQEIGFERTGTGTYSTVIDFSSGSANNRLLRCQMKAVKIPSNSSQGFQFGPGSCVLFSGGADSTEITNCKLIYGYNGIFSVQASTGVKITGNYIDTSGSAGIYMTTQTNLEIVGNTISMGDFGPNQGHYTSYGFRIEVSPAMYIAKNKVFMLAKNAQVCRAAVVANTTSTAAAPTLVCNNWLMNEGGTGDCTGLAVYGCNFLDFYSNNVLVNNSLSASAAYYHYGNFTNTNINLVNNNLINKGGGVAVSVPGTNVNDLVLVDHNNLYSAGTYLGKWGGTDYTTFSAWQAASGKDSNSMNVDPGYVSATNLHVSNIGINGKAIPYSAITDDIDGDMRDTVTPDIGADEFFPATLDVGISNIDSPMVFCPGTHPVKVSFTNYGTDTITSVAIDWSVNGSAKSTYNWTGSVAPGSGSSSITLGSESFSANTAYTIKVWSKNPNSGSDGNTQNDTLVRVRYAGLSGTYTIGDTSISDYKSFNDAVTDMTSRGICGALTFNVYPGVYNEQITLVQLPGMGSGNPVVFQSVTNDSTQVQVTLPSTTATGNNNAAIQLRGADYVTFKHITFERTGFNNFAHVVHILGGSNNNSFQGCLIRGINRGAVNINGNAIWSDEGIDNNNSFIGNYIVQGNVGILYTGTSTEDEVGTLIKDNVLDSAYANFMQISYNKGVQVTGNSFGRLNFNSAGSVDLQLNFCDSGIKVTENHILGKNSQIGIDLVGCESGASNPGIVANNFISKHFGQGILLQGVQELKVYHNNLYLTQNDSANRGIRVTTAGSAGIEILNNSILMGGGEIFDVADPTQISRSDYNNLYHTDSSFAIWGTITYDNFTDFQAVGVDSHSVSVDPVYFSLNNLHVKSPDLKGTGTPLSAVIMDIDGQTRNTTNPDIGADEFELVPNDAGITSIASPGVGVCSGLTPIKVVLKNFAKDTLKSVTIDWMVDSVAQTTFNWTGSLLTNAVDTVTLTASFALAGGPSSIFAKTSAPNGQNDEIGYNDSTRMNLQVFNSPPPNAGPDKILCLGDSILIGGNSFNGFTYEWTDMANNPKGSSALIYINTTVNASYQVKMTNNSSGCISLDTVAITVAPKPTLNAGTDQNVCTGFGVSIGESTPQSGHTYSWSSQSNGFTSINSQVTVVPTQTTSYILHKTDVSSACFIIDTVTLTLVPKQNPSFVGPNNICYTDTVTYSVTALSGSSYLWSAAGASIIGGQGTDQVDITWSSAGIQPLRLILTGPQGCIDTITKNINSMLKPIAMMSVDGSCTDRQISFSDVSTNKGSSTWTFGDGSGSNLSNINHVYTQAGTYQVMLVSKTGLCYDTAIQTLNVVDPPIAKFSTGPACEGLNTNFYDSSVDAVGWLWSIEGNDIQQQSPSYVFNTSGTVTVKLRVVGATGCLDSISKFVAVSPLPDADFSYEYKGDSLYLTPNTTSGTHFWDLGDGQTSTAVNPVHFYAQVPSMVFISHTITNGNGCSDNQADSVMVGPNALFKPAGNMNVLVYPNPFLDMLVLDFNLTQSSEVSIRLFDATGKQLITRPAANYEAGSVQVQVNTNELKLVPGIYFIELNVDGVRSSTRVVKVE